MKFLLSILFCVTALFSLDNKIIGDNEIVIAAPPVPGGEILRYIEPDLKKKGFTLTIKRIHSFKELNIGVQYNVFSASFGQNRLNVEEFNKENNSDLSIVAKVYIEPLNIYSKRNPSIALIKDGSSVGIPKDKALKSRALIILEKSGVLSLNHNKIFLDTDSIVSNPKHLIFIIRDSINMVNIVREEGVDIAMMTPTYARFSGFNLSKDLLYLEEDNLPYVSTLVVKEGHEYDPKIVALKDALLSQKVRNFINYYYKGDIIPSF